MSFCDKTHLEDGDKILLPPSALEILARLHIEYPMLFKVTNESANRSSHCGVLEFTAPEASCYMPYWMMQNLFISEGEIINVQNISLPKATFVKIRPQSTEFLDISNPRAVLEASLRKFSCMTVGDTICLKYNNKNFLLDVREVKPESAACIIETDCEVDFEAPADYVPEAESTAQSSVAIDSSLPYGGFPTVKTEDMVSATQLNINRHDSNSGGLRIKSKKSDEQNTDAAALRSARLRRFEVFHGSGQSLNGSVSSYSMQKNSEADQNNDAKQAVSSQNEAKHVPFQGSGRRLR